MPERVEMVILEARTSADVRVETVRRVGSIIGKTGQRRALRGDGGGDHPVPHSMSTLFLE
jgi:hypothetical protein